MSYVRANRQLGSTEPQPHSHSGVNWGELSAKVSILVGMLTAWTMIRHNWKG